MSDLSVGAVPEGAASPQRTAARHEVRTATGTGAKASTGERSAPDVSNYVTSPKGVVDPQSGVYVLQYRDGATGEVLNQYPSAKVVDAYKRGASNGEVATSPVASAAVGTERGIVEGVVKAAPPQVTSPAGSSVTPSAAPVGAQGATPPVPTPAPTPAPTSIDA